MAVGSSPTKSTGWVQLFFICCETFRPILWEPVACRRFPIFYNLAESERKMVQYKLTCCNKIYNSINNINIKKCPYCHEDKPICEEVDKEDEVIWAGFSGDKSYEKRPWGNFRVVLDEKNVKIKKITVNPEGVLSLQLHRYRDEWWKVIKGEGEVQIGNDILEVSKGTSLNIDRYQVHRISNTGDSDLIFVEVQTGVCNEDDIIRIEDMYGRNE